MRLTGDWLDHPGTAAVMQALDGAGGQAFFVGGCVRDAVLGRPVGDIDIATDLVPDRVVEAVVVAGLRAVPTGIEHGTVTVIAAHRPHEVTTFRRDVETFGRHATVAFSTDVAEDAARRDFTMNALYADGRGQVIDPLGSGLADAKQRHVRFIGHPEDRIREDYLRILRFFRFTAVVGDPDLGLDAEGLAACAALAEGIDGLSRERIGAEMRKLLSAGDPAPAVSAMAQAGLLARVLPGADARALAPLVHLEAGLSPDWLRRLAHDRVVVHGEVESATDFINQHSLMVVPLLSGGGMRAKILEGMALGKVALSTRIGMEGIAARHKKEALLADTPAEFAESIAWCYEQGAALAQIGDNARRLCTEQYDNLAGARRLLEAYHAARAEGVGAVR